jgi:trehalose 2-sulfotransferase
MAQPPHTSYLVYATVRSGSSLLCEALKNSGLAGRPEEYFWHGLENDTFYQGYNPADYAQYVRYVVESTATSNGVFGAKMMGGYLHSFVRRLRQSATYADPAVALVDIMADLFPNLKAIWLTRRNKVRQAVSWWTTVQSDQWSSAHPSDPTARLEYNFEAIDHLVQELVMREAALQEHFTECGIKPFVIVYEEFHDAYQETAVATLDYLEIATPAGRTFGERSLQKQANTLSEEWVQRYRQEKQANWRTRFW